jgi:glycosyltransferase involved in cell wall biosynthesis
LIGDMKEEGWLSMDLVAEMLFAQLQQDHSDAIAAALLRPPMRRRFTRVWPASNNFLNADRLINRFWDCQRWVRKRGEGFDLFHVVDHSYGQLVHYLPPERTVVTCHDLDAFRCLLSPRAERRSRLFRAMARRVLEGFRKAARVACVSAATRDELLAHDLLPPERVVVVHNGVAPAYSSEADAAADAEAARLLGPSSSGTVELLHVGSTARRKRVDVLLRVFAEARGWGANARLIHAGGQFTEAQLRLVDGLKLGGAVVSLPFLDARVLAAVYRRAALVLQTSEREGFGLPVAEAMACGTPVVASDLPVLREVGGEAASYAAVGDVPAWTETVISLLEERRDDPAGWDARRRRAISRASKFSWPEYARKMVALYQELR